VNTETDSMAPDSADPEDQAILEALDALASGDASAAGSADEALRRLYVEVLGLLPASLEPVIPADRVWQRLAAELQLPASGESPSEASAPQAQIVPPIDPPVAARSTTVPFAPAGSRGAMRRHSRWPLALAATLAFALAGLSLFLLKNLNGQTDQVATLYVRLAAAEREASNLRQAKGQLEEMEGKYSLVTDPAGSINRLAPASEQLQPNARGLLFVAADHNHWVLSLSNLEPTQAGQGYQLWFMGDSTAVSGGTFTARPGEVVNLSAESMPEGTKAILITLEPASGSPLPSGPKVLTTVG
jgi:hypothetical protein